MKKRLRVGILFGGRSGEHEVSLVSAASILRAIDHKKYDVVPIGITKDGHWLPAAESQNLLEGTAAPLALSASSAGANSHDLLKQSTDLAGKLDVVFPVLHGTFGEDGTIQGMLELADIPYVGSGVLGSAASMDKDVMKRLFSTAGLPQTPWISLTRTQWHTDPRHCTKKIEAALKYPLFVKPANLGSSVEIGRAHV